MTNKFHSSMMFMATIVLLLACKSNETKPAEPATIGPADSVVTVAPAFSDTVGAEATASTAIDYEGLYIGIVPCADCEGIETTLEIKADKKYKIKTEYLGKKDSKDFIKEGAWTWVNGNIIQLEGIENAPNKYFLSENKVFQLDMSGKRITGDLAEKYILKKVQ